LSNWENEIKRFYPQAVLEIYHGSQNEKMDLQYTIRRGIRDRELDIILTTYSMFERESGKDDRKFINKIPISYLVLDEAHCMKNRETQRYVNLNRVKARNRLLLSGTPVQNDLGELLALLSFLMPEVFGHENCDLLLEAFGLQKGVAFDVKRTGGLSLKQIKAMLAPFILRRRKSLVLDQLVAKETFVRAIPLTETQKLIYERILLGYSKRKQMLIEKSKAEEEEMRRLNCKIKGIKKKKVEMTESDAIKVDLTEDLSVVKASGLSDSFKGLTQSEAKHLFTALRKAANHPLLLRVKYKDDDILNKIANVSHIYQYFGNQCDLQRVRSELDLLSDFDIHQICMEYKDSLGQYELPIDALYESSKFVEMKALLPKLIAEDHRILIFSQVFYIYITYY
jgi:SWI/SNF-related matrix-associated actin-dependent regulator 1 of chromatin subfamily A